MCTDYPTQAPHTQAEKLDMIDRLGFWDLHDCIETTIAAASNTFIHTLKIACNHNRNLKPWSRS